MIHRNRDARTTPAAQIFRDGIAAHGLRAMVIDCAVVVAAVAALAASPFIAYGLDSLLMALAR